MSTVENCAIVKKVSPAKGIWDVTVAAPQICAQITAPGQFLNIKVGEKVLRRPISICDWGKELVRFVFEVRGEGTAWLAERAVGDVLDILGPLGNGFEQAGNCKNAIAVGGGIGVFPLLGLCETVAANGGSADALLGFRSKDNAVLLGDFMQAKANVAVATDDGTLGIHGFVTEILEKRLASGKECDGIFTCGPAPMMKKVAETAQKYNVPCYVSMEQRMGCGTGACLVCSCRVKKADGEGYVRVCKDGPVFKAESLVW
ncbi:MAG: dihydroorotate dehydrogenase electron transfer subunit [Ruminococcaceae bacterium]|nr:dihydroorotate dehydrogenase electron transfer subunit [Oscillospiraceae bacterium]